MKVVIGHPVMNRAWVLPAWFDAIDAQQTEHEIIVVQMFTESEDETEKILLDRGQHILYDDEPGRSLHEIDGHHWGQGKYAYMARLRNELTDYVEDLEPDYFFSLDSDILLTDDRALDKMLSFAQEHPGVCAPAVNMAHRATSWNWMDWCDPWNPARGANAAGRQSPPPHAPEADVIMAAMLLDRLSTSIVRWENHTQGEDVGFCLNAARAGVKRWWFGDLRLPHLMQRQTFP